MALAVAVAVAVAEIVAAAARKLVYKTPRRAVEWVNCSSNSSSFTLFCHKWLRVYVWVGVSKWVRVWVWVCIDIHIKVEQRRSWTQRLSAKLSLVHAAATAATAVAVKMKQEQRSNKNIERETHRHLHRVKEESKSKSKLSMMKIMARNLIAARPLRIAGAP